MKNFSIAKQLELEKQDYYSSRKRLGSFGADINGIRNLQKKNKDYLYSQPETIGIIDLYSNSQFENGPRDSQGYRKIFLNTGKFRTEVSSKQIDIDSRNWVFYPDDLADPWPAFFMQKEFREYTKDHYFAELINQCVEAYPKYGTVVLKKAGKELAFVPLQTLMNEQDATDLQTASYVYQVHESMPSWEIQEMKSWNNEGLDLRMDTKLTVYERYGRVPLSWLKKINGEEVEDGDEKTYVDALVIFCLDPKANTKDKQAHIFLAEEINQRPFMEAHWSRQHGRWLGVGVMEDHLENQRARNVVVNLYRRGLQWSSKRIGQSATTDGAAKNLQTAVKDGEVLNVGPNGQISILDLSARNLPEVVQFTRDIDNNSDQKAFTYEVATGESLPSGTPFSLGVLISDAANSYFNGKQEKLGLMFKRATKEFLLQDFYNDMKKKDRIVALYSDEPGFEALKAAAIQMIKSATVGNTLYDKGEPVKSYEIESLIDEYEAARVLPFQIAATTYDNIKTKFDFTITGEELDKKAKLETLKTIYQAMLQAGDFKRAERVLERLSALAGENISTFGTPEVNPPVDNTPPVPATNVESIRSTV